MNMKQTVFFVDAVRIAYTEWSIGHAKEQKEISLIDDQRCVFSGIR